MRLSSLFSILVKNLFYCEVTLVALVVDRVLKCLSCKQRSSSNGFLPRNPCVQLKDDPGGVFSDLRDPVQTGENKVVPLQLVPFPGSWISADGIFVW